VVILACDFIDPIHVHRSYQMVLGNGHLVDVAIDLTGSGEYDLNASVVFTTGFKKG